MCHYDGRTRPLAADSTGPAVDTVRCHNGTLDSRLQPWQVVAMPIFVPPPTRVIPAVAKVPSRAPVVDRRGERLQPASAPKV